MLVGVVDFVDVTWTFELVVVKKSRRASTARLNILNS